MKLLLLVILSILLSHGSFSQGIEFENGSWADILSKAKQLDKPIFIDVFTTWCGPCKQMSQKVFPLAEVGNYFNENFICYQIDAEKGEGIEVAKKYQVSGYPTFLFINPSGEMVYQSVGSGPSDQFIQSGKKAIKELNNPLGYPKLEKQYSFNKNNINFALAYLKKRIELNLMNKSLLDEYLSLLSTAQQNADSTLKLICSDNNSIRAGSLAFSILTRNKQNINSMGGNNIHAYNYVIYMAIEYKIKEAVRNKNEAMVEDAINMKAFYLGNDYKLDPDRLWMNYYEGTEQKEKYTVLATKFVDNTIMDMSMEVVKAKDAEYYKLWRDSPYREDSTTTDPNEWKLTIKYVSKQYSYQNASDLNDIAWNFFENISDKKALNKALVWSKKSLEFTGEEVGAYIDTYANLLYKLGNTDEAVQWEMKAISNGKEVGEDFSSYEQTLEKMRKGEPTWDENK